MILRNTRILSAGLILSALIAAPATAASYNLTMCGASPGGLWSLLGAGLDAAMKATDPGSTVTYQTSGGGFANVALLSQGKCDIALIHDAEARIAQQGKEPFKSPVNNLRAVAVMYTWAPMQMIINKDFAQKHGITSIEDIAKKKVPVRVVYNRKGNIASSVGEAMMEAAGADAKSIESWGGSVTYAASQEQGDLMRDRRADLLVNSLFVGHSSIREIAEAIPLAMLSVSDETAKKVSDQYGVGSFTIPAKSYDWMDKDTPTLTLTALLFAKADAPEAMVKDLTQAMVRNVGKIQGVHKAMAPLTPELMASSKVAEYHPAAKAVYGGK